jgi:gamma-glutamyl:cysteine ligase YbdK (ATP-grasp superfamily)
MAQAIASDSFTPEAYARFSERVHDQLRQLRDVVARPGFGEGPATLGAELELAIIDSTGAAAPVNRALLVAVDDPHLTFEIDRFNLEYNLSPVAAQGRPFSAMQAEMTRALAALNAHGRAMDAQVTTIGILPSLTRDDLCHENLTDLPRYRALSAGLRRMRPEPLVVRLAGREPLEFTCDDVALEGANTSFQVHLRVPPAAYAAHYNAAQLATAFALAAAGNSPLFLGHHLWDETRIALFKKVMDVRTPDELTWHYPTRVAFGHGWMRHGIAEPFAEAVAFFPPLMPICTDEPETIGRVPRLAELRLHTGTVWRWNRAIYDPHGDGHLRIEMRALPAGPTPIDMMANAALLVGLTVGLARREDPPLDWLLDAMPFSVAETNFYRAARDGLDARLLWPADAPPSPREHAVPALVRAVLPLAADGLASLGVADEEVQLLLGIIDARVRIGQTGARWQRRALAALEQTGLSRPQALRQLVLAYAARAAHGDPVHTWDLPT